MHDKDIRELTIDHQGMQVGRPFRNASGIPSGQFAHKGGPGETDRIAGLFNEGDARRESLEPDGR